MDYEPEFPYPSCKKDMETIKYYFDNETEFMAARNFFTNDLNILYRMHAVSVIAKVKECMTMMVNLCMSMNIQIDTSRSSEEVEEEDGTALIDKRRQDLGKTETSQLQMKEKPEELFDKNDVAAEETEAEKRSLAKGKGKGKAVEKVKEPQPQIEGSISEIEPKKFMNIELKSKIAQFAILCIPFWVLRKSEHNMFVVLFPHFIDESHIGNFRILSVELEI
ncbi:hypothetical protein TSUD_349890 [Trifolium subterraneum]|uniref:Uncharacterized protein n=1 Tax=Trifolium subterraneum TaxID=3900 RepID=A0A2Z6NAH0_TRISU|nr:hypothetical protein TSUD_349890 [Trifolium subterraneum]